MPSPVLEALLDLEGAGADLAAFVPDAASDDDNPDLAEDVLEALDHWRSAIEIAIEQISSATSAIDAVLGPGGAQTVLVDIARAHELIGHLWLVGHRRPSRRVAAFRRWAQGGHVGELESSVASIRQHRVALAAAFMAPLQRQDAEPEGDRKPRHTRRRRGRKHRYEASDDKALLRAWERAKSAEISREKFMSDLGRSVADLTRAQARQRRRTKSG